jgi:2'-5' RNA ligase
MRLFTSVDLSPRVLDAIGREIDGLRSTARHARWVDPVKLHLTLNFLGEQEETLLPKLDAAIAEVASEHPPLTLHASGGGGFGSKRHPRVLWIGVGGEVEALARIHDELAARLRALRVELELRSYAPHLTLARAKDPRGDDDLAACVERLARVDLGSWTVDELVLYQSRLSPKGATYTAVVRKPLTGPRR